MLKANSNDLEKAVWTCDRCNKRLESATAKCPCYNEPLNKTVSGSGINKGIEELRK